MAEDEEAMTRHLPPPPLPREVESPPPQQTSTAEANHQTRQSLSDDPRGRPSRPLDTEIPVAATVTPRRRRRALLQIAPTAGACAGAALGVLLFSLAQSEEVHRDLEAAVARAVPAQSRLRLLEGELERALRSSEAGASDPRRFALFTRARVEVSAADVAWLVYRIGEQSAADRQRLQRRSARALVVTEELSEVAAHDWRALALRVDALRIAGEIEAAHRVAEALPDPTADPDVAYAVGALALATGSPTAVSSLELGFGAERYPGTVHATLALAYLESEEIEAAASQVEALRALPSSHPALPALERLFEHTPSKHQARSAENDELLIQQATAALRARQWSSAKRSYDELLRLAPHHPDALCGLGAIARAGRNLHSARWYYRRALESDPDHLPGLLGLADTEWELDHRERARQIYQRLLQRHAPGSFPERVEDRAGP